MNKSTNENTYFGEHMLLVIGMIVSLIIVLFSVIKYMSVCVSIYMILAMCIESRIRTRKN